MSFTKILAALDQSALAPAVFDKALQLAQQNNAALMLLHCISDDFSTRPIGLSEQFGVSPHLFDQAYQAHTVYLDQQVTHTLAMLRSYWNTAMQQGISTQFEYKVGDPGSQICHLARHWQADLIVMGRRGRRGLTEVLLGSVSNYVLHHACCSVLVVQAQVATAKREEARGERQEVRGQS